MNTNHVFSIDGFDDYHLCRFPKRHREPLFAWDAADHYLLEMSREPLNEAKNILILNDSFGALSLALNAYTPTVYTDSWMSAEAIRRNLGLNGLDPSSIKLIHSLENLSDSFDLVIGRVPKSKAHLAYLLHNIRSAMADSALMLLSGMDKHLSKGQFDLLAKHFGPSSFERGWKKARVWRATFYPGVESKHEDWREYELESSVLSGIDLPMRLKAMPAVFCSDHLDIGSRFFIENFASLPVAGRTLDLACGNGVLGLAYQSFSPNASVDYLDESWQACESVRANLKENFPVNSSKVFQLGSMLEFQDNSYDLVLCNPPFHQSNTVIKHIAEQMFKETRSLLSPSGEFWLVANRHLGYHIILKKYFPKVETIAGNSKFVVLRASN